MGAYVLVPPESSITVTSSTFAHRYFSRLNTCFFFFSVLSVGGRFTPFNMTGSHAMLHPLITMNSLCSLFSSLLLLLLSPLNLCADSITTRIIRSVFRRTVKRWPISTWPSLSSFPLSAFSKYSHSDPRFGFGCFYWCVSVCLLLTSC